MNKILQTTAVSVGVFASAFVAAVQLFPVLLDNETAALKKETNRVVTGEIKEHTPASKPVPVKSRPSKIDRHIDCLARNIYYEARGEPYDGKVAVAQVTLNRAKNRRFPNDVCAVVYQKTTTPDNVVICQFSWFCDPSHTSKPLHPPSWTESKEVARKVLLEGHELPELKGALFFHATYISPGWKRDRIGVIGQHVFYR